MADNDAIAAPQGASIIGAQPAQTPDTQNTQPTGVGGDQAIPAPAGGSIITGPSNTNSTTQEQPGLLSRAYETSGLKGLVDLGTREVNRPIDLYHQAVESFKKGDWKSGTETAFKLVHLMPDKDDPLAQAAMELVKQPINDIKEDYKANRAAGMNPVEAAIVPGAALKTAQTVSKVRQENAAGQPNQAAGTLVSGMGDAISSGVPVLGNIAKSISSLLGKDIHDENWTAAAGDVLGPLLTMGTGKALGALGKAGQAGVLGSDVSKNLIRPGTTDIAGVKVPVSTASVADASGASKVLQKGATASGAQKFINEYTSPAAEEANVANMGEAASRSVDEIRALRGEPLTAQNPLKIQNIDDAANALRTEAKPTYEKLDQAAEPEIQRWQNAKNKWDTDNPKPEPPAAKPPSPTVGTASPVTQTEKAVYKQRLQQWKEDSADWEDANPKPKTFTELQDQYNEVKSTIKTRGASQADKADAIKNLPQFKQELDDFLTRHANVVDPNELQTANKVWAQSKQYDWMADRVRTATTREATGNAVLKSQPVELNYGRLKSLPNQFDNKFGDGAWEKTLGTEGVQNYESILNALKNPISGGVDLNVFLRAHPFGTYLRAATGPVVVDNLLFNPTFGQTVLKLWEKSKVAPRAASTIQHAPKSLAISPTAGAVKRNVYNNASGLNGNE